MNKETIDNGGMIQNSATKIAEVYFNPKPWESEKLYKALGVKQFQKALKTLPIYRMQGEHHELSGLYKLGIFNESVHVAGLSIATLIAIPAIRDGDLKAVGINAGINTVINFYPIISQRYNRIRLKRVLKKQKHVTEWENEFAQEE